MRKGDNGMKFKELKTASGLMLYHMYLPWSQSVASGVLVKVGTLDENWPDEAGLAHASEHMRFQGTTNPYFPNSQAISACCENVGGYINAWTGYEGTFFYNVLPALEFSRSPYLLADMMLNPAFPEEKINVEMNNIIQEIKRDNDDPMGFLGDKFTELMYSGSLYSRRILGIESSVGAFTRKHFLDFADRFFNSNNFTFFVVGNVAESEVIISFDEYFFRHCGEKNNNRQINTPDLPAQTTVFPKEIEQVHLMIGFQPTVMAEKDIQALRLFSYMIDGGMSFPLFQIVRDKHGLCYHVNAGCQRGSGNLCHFEFYVGTDPQKYQKAEELILKIVDDCKNDMNLLSRAKELMLGRLALSYENTSNILMNAVRDVLETGKPKSQQERMNAVKSVTIEDVKKAVIMYLTPERMIRVMLKPK